MCLLPSSDCPEEVANYVWIWAWEGGSTRCFRQHSKIDLSLLQHQSTVQQALRVKWRVFGVFVCFDLYFVNYRSWQAEILQECAEGCIQGDLQKKIRQT